MARMLKCILLCATVSLVLSAAPLVTLSHGGQLLGKRFTYITTDVDLFQGIPYAAPPVGDLRFKKPVPLQAWTGVKDAKHPGNACVQLDNSGALVSEEEDCLFLDIVVPGGVNTTNKKPVMVWIYGGGYTTGTKDTYIGASLAVTGDVIVVTINYRLGVLGFLSDGPGTGNFGLWDQRQALLWVKENIGQFGGDPDLVTIFGESAGAGSVSAQMMSPHNDRLFKRAIQESGSLYQNWGWYLSQNQLYTLSKSIKDHNKCPLSESVYQCLSKMSVKEVFTNVVTADPLDNYWHPTPDDDFFPSNITDEVYDLTGRFDLLAGFNGQEGAMLLNLYLVALNQTGPNGVNMQLAVQIINLQCKTLNPLSPELCVNFLIKEYGLDRIDDDKERGIRLSYILGELWFNIDIVRQLRVHSSSSKSTYGYHFTELFTSGVSFWEIPSWLKVSADHGEEVPFVFGVVHIIENSVVDAYFDGKIPEAALPIFQLLNKTLGSDRSLTDLVMTMWTNFAKSGNPNQPVALPAGTPTWPQFDTNTNQFMELNSSNIRVITTPEKERLENVQKTVFSARRLQTIADKAPADMNCDDDADGENKRKPDDDGAASHTTPSSVLLLITLLCLPLFITSS